MKDYSRFISELTSRRFFAREAAMLKYDLYIMAMAQGKVPVFPDIPELKMGMFDGMGMPCPDDKEDVENIAVIPLNGILTRYGSWYDYGTEDIAEMYESAFENPSIVAVVTAMDCDGGSPDAFFPLQEVFAKKNKPLICAVKGGCYSLGYMAACNHDKILAINNMVEIGSIGVMAKFRDMDGYFEKLGAKTYEEYATASNWKNKTVRDLKAGKPETLITEELDPWAKYFMDMVIDKRPTLNQNVEGVLNGRTFFANYGELTAKMSGLIDDVMPMDDIIQYAFNMAKATQVKSLFNN